MHFSYSYIFSYIADTDTTMPQRNRAEELQGEMQPSDCSKKCKPQVDICDGTNKSKSEDDNIDYERLAKYIFTILSKWDISDFMKNETNQENWTASVKPEFKEDTAGELVGTSNDCVNSNHVISLSKGIPLGATVSHESKIWHDD